MRKTTRRSPEVESLESLMLLSTGMAGSHHVKVPVQVVPAHVALVGTIHASGHLSGSVATVGGSGNLSPVGSSSFQIKADLNNPPSSVTLSTKHGKLYLVSNTTTPLVQGSSGSVSYQVKGGTGSYVGATGSGLLSASVSELKNHKLAVTLRFS